MGHLPSMKLMGHYITDQVCCLSPSVDKHQKSQSKSSAVSIVTVVISDISVITAVMS